MDVDAASSVTDRRPLTRLVMRSLTGRTRQEPACLQAPVKGRNVSSVHAHRCAVKTDQMVGSSREKLLSSNSGIYTVRSNGKNGQQKDPKIWEHVGSNWSLINPERVSVYTLKINIYADNID